MNTNVSTGANTKGAYTSAVLFSVFIGLSFLFMKMSLAYADTLLILAHRFTVGVGGFALYRLYKGHSLTVTWSDLIAALPTAILYPVFFFLFQGIGLKTLSSSEAGMIHAMVPVMALILSSVILKEGSNTVQKLSVLISVTGVLFIFVMKGVRLDGTDQIGIIMALLSALASALYGIFARKRLKNYSYVDLTYIILIVGFVAFNGAYFLSSAGQSGLGAYVEPLGKGTYILSVLYLGIFSSVLSSLFSNHALSILPAARISVFNNLSTLVSVGAGSVFLGEPLYSYHIIGAVLIIAGVVGTNMGQSLKLSRAKA